MELFNEIIRVLELLKNLMFRSNETKVLKLARHGQHEICYTPESTLSSTATTL